MKKIDAHQHLIYPDRFTYPWLDSVPPLQGPGFDLAGYQKAAVESEIIASIFMEVDVAADQSAEEARFFCGLADSPENRLAAVIAAARPESADLAQHLDAIAHPGLVGIRRVLHTQDDALSRSSLFRENIRELGQRGLAFDMCYQAKQLSIACELADACPDTRLMLDHCGVPDIAGGGFDFWKSGIAEVARREHVFCKLSGIIAYAGADTIQVGTFEPWFHHVLECFGPARIVWGSDWPVCNLTASLAEWSRITEQLLASLEPGEQERILVSNATDFYRLQLPNS